MSAIASPELATKKSRLESLDALRGFDMFWITGAEYLREALKHYDKSFFGGLFYTQLTHVDWIGFHFEDLIFPLFVFIAGVSITFSISSIVTKQGEYAAIKHIFKRTFVMYVIGLLYYGGFSHGLEHVRFLGVLQRIAICYMIGSICFIYLKPKALLALTAIILVSYWLMMKYIPIPIFGAGNYEEGKNLANWIDKQYLPGRLWDKDHDPEGLLSTLPAVSSCLLGILAGLFLRSEKSSSLKVKTLILGGIALVIGGYLFSTEFPVIKKIWSSSFVLIAGGYSAILLGVFYLVIDVLHIKKWAVPFTWLGTNALTIYLMYNLVSFPALCGRLVGGTVAHSLDNIMVGLGDTAFACVNALLCIAIVRFLYKKNIVIRI
jgi:predicted acyltransferase